MARCRLYMVNGDMISSWGRVLNSDQQLKRMKEVNFLTVAVAEVTT
jgi:hypothetical protein